MCLAVVLGGLSYAINTVAGVSLGTDNKITFDHSNTNLIGKTTAIMVTATDSDMEGDEGIRD